MPVAVTDDKTQIKCALEKWRVREAHNDFAFNTKNIGPAIMNAVTFKEYLLSSCGVRVEYKHEQHLI